MNNCEKMRASAAEMLRSLGFQSGFADSALLVRLGYVYCNGGWKQKNSSLTAAAPDLYAALERIVDSVARGTSGDVCQTFDFDDARAALAKARGEP